jgi:hypothetical protein
MVRMVSRRASKVLVAEFKEAGVGKTCGKISATKGCEKMEALCSLQSWSS